MGQIDTMLKVLKLLAPTLIGFFYLFLIFVVFDRTLGLVSLPILIAIEAYIISKDWGVFLIIMEKYDQAVAYFTRKINSTSANAGVYNGRGTAYFMKGDSYAALRDFKKAIQIDPKYINAHDNLGGVYSKIGDPEMALASYQNAIAITRKMQTAILTEG
jgi:tetratricopeptide (TPR) repeat protein